MPVVDPLLDDQCDPACQLENCLKGLMPPSWTAKGCKGKIDVSFFVRRLRSDKGTLRCKTPTLADVETRIETDPCSTPDCSSGIVERHIRALLDGCDGISCCCATLVSDVVTDRTIDQKTGRERRVLNYTVSLSYETEKSKTRSEKRKMRRAQLQQEKGVENV